MACLAGWDNAGELGRDFAHNIFQLGLMGRRLTRAMTRLAKRHLIALRPLQGTKYTASHLPYSSGNATVALQLVKQINVGGYGTVWSATLQDETHTRSVVVKFANRSSDYAELIMEMLIQSVLRCVLPGPDNPVPAVIAPVIIRHGRDRPALVMENAGQSLYNFLDRPSEWLFLVVGLVATYIQVLQERINFRHADLHPGNVLIANGDMRAVELDSEDDTVLLQTPVRVSLIDFGNSCLTVDGKELRVQLPGPDVYNQQCDANNAASDLFLLLAKMAMVMSEQRITPEQQAFRQFNIEVVSQASGVSPEAIPTWGNDEAYGLTSRAKLCTPEYVLARCVAALRRRE